MKTQKYSNIKTQINGIKFDSKKEAEYYRKLTILLNSGIIANLELQKKYTLIPSQKLDKGGAERAVTYNADFVYEENGITHVVDTKGFKTKDYIIKRKLMKLIHNIEIIEV